jgi:uncharacterized protein
VLTCTRRRLRHAALALLAAGLVLPVPGAHAEPLVAVPGLKARVTDLAGTLTPDQAAALEAKLAAFEQAKGSQVAVLIVPTTRPEEIEQYGIRVGEDWKLGRKGVDDGAILLVAREDRKVRIEVGYGLEGVLPDATANRIIDEDIVPKFRAGDYYGGIDAGVDRMLRVIEGEALPEPAQRAARGSGGLGNLLPFLLIFALVGGSVLRRLFGRVVGALATGGLVGIVTWLIISVIGLSVFAGVVAFVFSLASGMGGGSGGNGWYSGRHGRGGGFPGGFGGGGFGGGGGGFGGGGGGFGGGGASGSW